MSDHEVSKPAQAHDVDDAVDAASPGDAGSAAEHGSDAAAEAAPDAAAVAESANEGLAEAARAADDATAAAGATATGTQDAAADATAAADEPAADAPAATAEKKGAADPDLAAFEEAEAAFPGTFGGGTFTPPPPAAPAADSAPAAETAAYAPTTRVDTDADAPTQVLAPAATAAATAAAATASGSADAPLPIFVQAPEAPRERSNRGAIFGIGLLAAVAFAILYLGTAVGIAAFDGKVSADNIGTYLLDQLRSAGLWVPVVVFAIGFWLLGAIINRGRWGFWVVFGIIVGVFAYAGHVLGAVGAVEFWKLSGSQLADTVNGQLLAPLAIAAFIFGRELTIWFGAWAARTGARRTVQNEEAQREYERVLEAGPQLPR